MKVRALVAKTDGKVGHDGTALLPGSVVETPADLPVVLGADGQTVGRAKISVEGNDVYAEMEFDEELVPADRRVPTIGFVVEREATGVSPRCVEKVEVLAIHLEAQNADARIGAIESEDAR